jgi:hypothetical protein
MCLWVSVTPSAPGVHTKPITYITDAGYHWVVTFLSRIFVERASKISIVFVE